MSVAASPSPVAGPSPSAKLWYRATEGSRYSTADVNAFGPTLVKLVRKQQGKLAAADIVEEGKDPNSPLHAYFEWDNTAAAFQFREEQARQMSRSILICWKEKHDGGLVEKSTRLLEFVFIPAAGAAAKADKDEEEGEGVTIRPGRQTPIDRRTQRLVTIDEVVENPVYIEQKLREAIRELEKWQRKYEFYVNTASMFRKTLRRIWNAINSLGR